MSSKTFYETLRLIFFISKIIGICSIEKINVSDTFRLNSKLKSYSTMFFLTLRYGLCLYNIVKMYIISNVNVQEYSIFINNITSSIICIYTEPLTLNVIFKIERCKYVNRKNWQYFWISICIVSFTFVSILCIYINENVYRNSNVYEIFSYLCFCYHQLTCIVIIIQFLIFSTEIRNQFKYFNVNLKKQFTEHPILGIEIETNRNKYENLILITEDMNSSIGLRSLIPIFAIPLQIFIQFYKIVFQRKWGIMILVEIFVFSIYIIGIYCMSFVGFDVKQMVGEFSFYSAFLSFFFFFYAYSELI